MQAVLWRTRKKEEKPERNDSENLQNMMVKNESSRDSDLGFILAAQKARTGKNANESSDNM
jgi:hypothetical protein